MISSTHPSPQHMLSTTNNTSIFLSPTLQPIISCFFNVHYIYSSCIQQIVVCWVGYGSTFTQSIMYSTPPPAPHPPANMSLHLLWYRLIVVCCFLIFYWSCGSQLTIPAQTPHHDAWGLLAHSAANLRRTRRPFVLFNGSMLGEGLMPCWLGRDAAGRRNCRPYDARRWNSSSVGGAAWEFLGRIRANWKSANVTARALVCVTR